MNWLESFKHWLGFHGKDVEWLDERTWPQGWYLRTSYCPQCDVVFYRGNVDWEPRQIRMSLEELRRERDAERERFTAYIQSRAKEFEIFRHKQDAIDARVYGNIRKLQEILRNDTAQT